jgi:hypothetical protein
MWSLPEERCNFGQGYLHRRYTYLFYQITERNDDRHDRWYARLKNVRWVLRLGIKNFREKAQRIITKRKSKLLIASAILTCG